MAVSDDFLDFVLDQFSSLGGVTARRMFGGAGLYRDGRMFGLVADDVVYLKVDDTNRAEFVEASSKQFKPYPAKAAVMPYYEVPPGVLDDPDDLADWARKSLAVASRKKK